MKRGRAYVDSSLLVAILFRERSSAAAWRAFRSQDVRVTVGLARAEVMAALAREGRATRDADALFDRMYVFHPDSDLVSECDEVLGTGALKGADLWHCAAALALAGPRGRKGLAFLTLDDRQRTAMRRLGFRVGP